ncbi:uncharacterized protein LOC125493748 [Beta vulgaris subsp. vulgaris]|uniref:uncharacterized protein LOC125493748 n=1 Tax=Beta vulgaris subsp. vulgaris TaxID=3555 RepID=UPI00203676A3|nr:uncharacterized protein LOC125493748 [Beta vulgaris subsp. vulgaris]
MTIFEYYGKFIALSRFALEVVATEELKAQRFEQGLTAEIQLGLGGETFNTSLDVVYGRTSNICGLQSRRDKKNVVGETTKITTIRVDRRPERVHHCKSCDKNHPRRVCKEDLVTCNYCQKKGHREYECYSKQGKDKKGHESGNQVRSGFNQSGNQGPKCGGQQNNHENYSKPASENPNQDKPASKQYVMSRKEAEKSADVVSDYKKIDLSVSIPTREIIRCTKFFTNWPLKIGDCIFPSNLKEFTFGDLDVILGMNRLSLYKANIDCEDVSKEVEIKLEDVPIVNEFMGVFPCEISDMPPARAVEFTIDLVPGTTPISKAPYRIAPLEMRSHPFHALSGISRPKGIDGERLIRYSAVFSA